MPGVSMNTIWECGDVTTACTDVRVVWGLDETMASLPPAMAFRRVDFPALGRPMIVTNPETKSLATVGTS